MQALEALFNRKLLHVLLLVGVVLSLVITPLWFVKLQGGKALSRTLEAGPIWVYRDPGYNRRYDVAYDVLALCWVLWLATTVGVCKLTEKPKGKEL